jgi:hypothetical protein
LVLIDAYGDEFTMNFAVVGTNLKSDLTRFCAKESALNNNLGELRVYERENQTAIPSRNAMCAS